VIGLPLGWFSYRVLIGTIGANAGVGPNIGANPGALALVLLVPIAIGALIGLHLVLVAVHKHTQFREPGHAERNVVGSPMWPGYVLRSGGLFLAVAAALVLLGGLVQINPVWLWGPYEPWEGTNGAQPDWYLGWLIGALRLMPAWEPSIGGVTLIPNPFFGGILFPLIVSAILYLWPALERRLTKDHRAHHLLDRPRDAPRRTAAGVALVVWVATTFLAGSADRIFVQLGFSYEAQIWFFRAGFFVFPPLAYLLTKRICEELRASEQRPLRAWTGQVVRRGTGGGFERVDESRPR
jgi:ubiquinol-cytochrome c reductase cytochrome b subunit